MVGLEEGKEESIMRRSNPIDENFCECPKWFLGGILSILVQ